MGFVRPHLRKGLYVSGDMIGGKQQDYNWRQIGNQLQTAFGTDGIMWDDLSVSLTRDKQGQSSKPDYSFTENGLLFPQNDAAEIIYLVLQMKHAKVLGTPIHPHVHYIQDEAEQPVWKIDYRFYNNGAAVPGSWTTISTADEGGNPGIFTYTSGTIMQICGFPLVPAPTSEGVSANLDLRFYRDDNVVTGDVLAKYVDFHYQINSLGSDDEYAK